MPVQGFRVGPGETCPKCGEDRLVSKVEDARGTREYCSVCATEFNVVLRGVPPPRALTE